LSCQGKARFAPSRADKCWWRQHRFPPWRPQLACLSGSVPVGV
jgi:hypothetical protein